MTANFLLVSSQFWLIQTSRAFPSALELPPASKMSHASPSASAKPLIVDQTHAKNKVPARAAIGVERFLSEDEIRVRETRRLQELLALREELRGIREADSGGSAFGRVFVQPAGLGTVRSRSERPQVSIFHCCRLSSFRVAIQTVAISMKT